MGASFSSGGEDETIAAINVTPLVDVVLVLLVIFMITAPLLYPSAIKVQLPKANSGEKSQTSPLDFTLSKDGSLIWNKRQISLDDLKKELATKAPAPEDTAVISADEQTPHGLVIQLMDTLKQAGLSRFALNVSPTGGKK